MSASSANVRPCFLRVAWPRWIFAGPSFVACRAGHTDGRSKPCHRPRERRAARSLSLVGMRSDIPHHGCGPVTLAAGTPLDHHATPLSRGQEDTAVPGVAPGDLRGRQSSYALKRIPVQKPAHAMIRLPPGGQDRALCLLSGATESRSPATPAKQQSIQEPPGPAIQRRTLSSVQISNTPI